MKTTLNLNLVNRKIFTKSNPPKRLKSKTESNNYTMSVPVFYSHTVSFGQNQSLTIDDNIFFNEEDENSFSIKFFNRINNILAEYKNNTSPSESLYLLGNDKTEKAAAKKNVTIMNKAGANQVNAELVDLFNFASANKIQTKSNTYLFDNSLAKNINAKNIYLSDNVFSSKNEAETVWLKDNASTENIVANVVYQRNNSKSNEVTTKNFYAADNASCKTLTANNILLRNSVEIENATVTDGQVTLQNNAKIQNLSTQNSKIILNKNTSITNVSSEDNLTITGNGTIGDINVKGTHVFITGPVKITGKITFSNQDGVVIAQRGKLNIFPKIDSTKVDNGILQFLIQDQNNVYLGNPSDVFSSGLDVINTSIEEKKATQLPIHSNDNFLISEIENNTTTKNLYADFYKDNLQLLTSNDNTKNFSLFWVKNAKLGEKRLVDLWMEILGKIPNTIPDTQKTYKINNLTDKEKNLLLEKTTLYWFKEVLPKIKKEQDFNDFDSYKNNLDDIENILNKLNSFEKKNIKSLTDDENFYKELTNAQFSNKPLIDFWINKDGSETDSDLQTERLRKEYLKEILNSQSKRKKVIQSTRDELKKQKDFIKSYEFACTDLIQKEPELDKLQRKLLSKYKESALFYHIISETTNKTNNVRKIENKIIKILQSLTNEQNQLSIDARKNIFDKTLNIQNVITTKPNTELDNYINFVFTSLSQNISKMTKEEFYDFVNDINAFKNFSNKNSVYFCDYWTNMVKTAYQFYSTQMLDMIMKNNIKLLYSFEQNKKNSTSNDIEFISDIQKNSTETIEQQEFVSRFKDNDNFKKLMNNNGIDRKKALTELLMTEALNENLYQNRLNAYPKEITPDSIKENLDLTDKYLVLLDKDYSDMSIKEKYQAISKVPNEEFRLMNKIILNNWKKNELQKYLNNKFVQMQLDYNINAQSKHIRDNLEKINDNLNNIILNIEGQNYTLKEIASNLDTLVNVSKKSFQELYFIGENIEAINKNTQSIKANTRAVLYATMQNSKLRCPELSKMIEELLPEVEKGSFNDFLKEVEKKYKQAKEEKRKKNLKQIANLAVIAAAASGIGCIDPSVLTGLIGSEKVATHAIAVIKPIADTLKHVAIFKAANTGTK